MLRRNAPSKHLFLLAASFLVVVLSAGSARANFVKLAGGVDQPCRFDTRYTFDFVGNPAFNDLVTWDVRLNGPVAGGKVNLTATLRHFLGVPQCDNGHGANANGQTFTFTVAGPAAGAVTVAGKAALISHGNHSDVFRATVTAAGPAGGNPAMGSIHTSGMHTPGVGLNASIENNGAAMLKNVSITPSYFDPKTGLTTNGPKINRPNIKPGAADKVDLPKAGNLLPTNYTVSASGSPNTETTIAFLGTWDGMPAELPLGDLAELFGGSSEFLLPMLRASDGVTDLFVGVDLTQWLSDPRTFTAGDVFTFSSGMNAGLPGFLVGTSPITFDSATGGFTTAAPYNDDAFVTATIDGSTIPEPASLGLLIGSLAMMAAISGNKRRRR